jgi:hypothetical protein
MSEQEIKKYLASIGSKGGKAGSGKSKVRGGPEYYKRISQLAAKARKARHKGGITKATSKERNK